VLLLGISGFFIYGFTGGFRNTPPRVVCTPPNAPQCSGLESPHDLGLVSLLSAAPAGTPVAFAVTVPPGETARGGYSLDFGDGSPVVATNNTTATHAYRDPGLYLASVQASIGGVVHDNLAGLAAVRVFPAPNATANGTTPVVTARVVANGTTPSASRNATAVLQPGESVTLEAGYAAPPSNGSWATIPPRIIFGPGATILASNENATSASISLSFASSGSYPVTFEGGASPANGPSAQAAGANYTWTVFVAPVGVNAGIAGAKRPAVSPHPGTIVSYELSPTGAQSLDPAIDYETAGEEAIANVYQTLLAYNGSSVGAAASNFLPELATCVPGSARCSALYGTSLVSGDNYTVALDAGARFYDPVANRSWPVYPSDVVFSVARTMGFSDLPCQGCNNGWILTQALAPAGNGGWDGGRHAPYNNTPQAVFGSMSVNDSRWCPAAAMTSDHGCVTFHASGGGRSWPFFLELLANPLGASVVPCGWFSASARGAGIPGWNASAAGNGTGDGPCLLPGNATSTTQPSFLRAVAGLAPASWDAWETQGSGTSGRYLGTVNVRMAGSGPYALGQYAPQTSYTLVANPAYSPNPRCIGSGCEPARGTYAPRVIVTWEPTTSEGIQALAAGIADRATLSSADYAAIYPLLVTNRARTLLSPTLETHFDPFDLNFNVRGASQYAAVTVPNDWFSYLGMREFFARAYPYAVLRGSVLSPLGIPAGVDFGGAIPLGLPETPTSIPWPNGNPCRDIGSPACPSYWYVQMLNASGPYYDPQLAQCTPANPCSIPMFGPRDEPLVLPMLELWASDIQALSDGTISVPTVALPSAQVTVNSEFATPGSNPMPVYALDWTPDYPDPSDYVQALYVSNGTFPFGDALEQSLVVPAFGTRCAEPPTNFTWYADLAAPVPQSCQGVAFQALQAALGAAAAAPLGPVRAGLYADAERIANGLALYVYAFQANLVQAFAPWIDSSSVNTNPVVGGLGIWPFFSIATAT
jgi:peptide/nickel transport system substrate-binding protein